MVAQSPKTTQCVSLAPQRIGSTHTNAVTQCLPDLKDSRRITITDFMPDHAVSVMYDPLPCYVL